MLDCVKFPHCFYVRLWSKCRLNNDIITVYSGSCKLHIHHAIPSATSLVIQSAWQLLETKWTVKLTFCCSEEDGKFSGCLCNSNANNNTTWKRFTVSSVIFSNGSHLVSLPFSLPSVTSHKSFYCFSYLRFNFFLLHFYLEKNPQTSEHDCGHPLIAADLVSFILHVKPVMLTVKFHMSSDFVSWPETSTLTVFLMPTPSSWCSVSCPTHQPRPSTSGRCQPAITSQRPASLWTVNISSVLIHCCVCVVRGGYSLGNVWGDVEQLGLIVSYLLMNRVEWGVMSRLCPRAALVSVDNRDDSFNHKTLVSSRAQLALVKPQIQSAGPQ